MRRLIIVVPGPPPPEANPNRSGGHWGGKVKAMGPWRDSVFLQAVNARNLWEWSRKEKGGLYISWPPLARATITVTFTVPDHRYEMDDQNTYSAMKEAVDELTMPSERKNKRGAAILLDDAPENLTWTKPVWKVVKGLERRDMTTTIEIREVADV